MGDSAAELLAAAVDGDRVALARTLSLVERGGDGAREISRLAFSAGDDSHTIGVTGAPGAGKSTLTSALVRRMRAAGHEVAVLAIDPSSPFSGGAILGDRVRMGEHVLDPDVFIRSMATRGHLGGRGVAVPEAARVLRAVGYPWVIVETVGIGQVELDVAAESDTTVVVVNPGWGDAVQANKAGLFEIADVFVVNKGDRPGTSDTVADLERMLSMRGGEGWRPRVIVTTATTGDGVDELFGAVTAHRDWSVASGALDERRARRREVELERLVEATIAERARRARGESAWSDAREAVRRGDTDPWSVVESLLD